MTKEYRVTDEASFRAALAEPAKGTPYVAMAGGLVEAVEPAVRSAIQSCWVRGLDDEAAILAQLADRAKTRAAHAMVCVMEAEMFPGVCPRPAADAWRDYEHVTQPADGEDADAD
jgi:hypothetical protein